jgi:hypothetical protein
MACSRISRTCCCFCWGVSEELEQTPSIREWASCPMVWICSIRDLSIPAAAGKIPGLRGAQAESARADSLSAECSALVWALRTEEKRRGTGFSLRSLRPPKISTPHRKRCCCASVAQAAKRRHRSTDNGRTWPDSRCFIEQRWRAPLRQGEHADHPRNKCLRRFALRLRKQLADAIIFVCPTSQIHTVGA